MRTVAYYTQYYTDSAENAIAIAAVENGVCIALTWMKLNGTTITSEQNLGNDCIGRKVSYIKTRGFVLTRPYDVPRHVNRKI